MHVGYVNKLKHRQ